MVTHRTGGIAAVVDNSEPHRPVPLQVLPDGIPAELIAVDQFVIWRYVHKDGTWTKPPFIASDPAKLASSTDPTTWRPYTVALAAYHNGKCDGLGVPMVGGLAGVDLDHCIDSEGTISPWAKAIVAAVNSYTELSPSGHGLRIFVRGTLPPGGRKAGDVEMYDHGRYLTVTGHHVAGTPTSIEERTAALAVLHARTFPTNGNRQKSPTTTKHAKPALTLDDTELLYEARSARNGTKFFALWSGDTSGYGGDDSAADLALCDLLALWTGADASRMDRLFRQCGLMREKWDEQRGELTYGDRTINTAIAGCRETYRWIARDCPITSSPVIASSVETPAADQADTSVTPERQRLVLDPADPLPSARAFLDAQHTVNGYVALLHQTGVFYDFDASSNAYRDRDEGTVRSAVYKMLESCMRWTKTRSAQPMNLVPFQPTKARVENVVDALRALTNLPAASAPPCWLRDDPGVDARDIIAVRNGLLHVPRRTLLPATPTFFNLQGIALAYDPSAPEPTAWLQFLHDLWGEDAESIATLQEAFGYNLTPQTHLQKILMLVGPKRSGKGTIARIMRLLLGERNCCGPTLAGLGEQFGLAILVGKSLAIISDARIGGRTDTAILTERLLSISGEDALSIPRKFLPDWTGTLPTRFWLLTNVLPKIEDGSGALASRFIVLRLTKSFYGREDHGLLDKLIPDLPGILNWALVGYERLYARGRFEQPASAGDLIQEFEDLGSPIGAFVRERCEVGPGFEVPKDQLFNLWKTWCAETGREKPGTIQVFARNLRSTVPWLGESRPHVLGVRVRYFEGVRPREDAE